VHPVHVVTVVSGAVKGVCQQMINNDNIQLKMKPWTNKTEEKPSNK
jgi:hypothetical protein